MYGYRFVHSPNGVVIWRPGLTQIRVHELASELNVSTQQVLSLLEELGKKVRGPSTVIGASDAAKVRGRFRMTRSHPATDPATPLPADYRPAAAAPVLSQSLFLPPVAPAVQPVMAPSSAAFADPFAVPAGVATSSNAQTGPTESARAAGPVNTARAGKGVVSGKPDPSAVTRMVATPAIPLQASPVDAVPGRPRGVGEPLAPAVSDAVVDHDAEWQRRGMNQADREAWCAAGLRPLEAELAERCRSVGITPGELSMKLSGRTGLQRLRDGEATTSVWARIREVEQQPGKAGTKLTGRFQLS
jgi:hypothetical protein